MHTCTHFTRFAHVIHFTSTLFSHVTHCTFHSFARKTHAIHLLNHSFTRCLGKAGRGTQTYKLSRRERKLNRWKAVLKKLGLPFKKPKSEAQIKHEKTVKQIRARKDQREAEENNREFYLSWLNGTYNDDSADDEDFVIKEPKRYDEDYVPQAPPVVPFREAVVASLQQTKKLPRQVKRRKYKLSLRYQYT